MSKKDYYEVLELKKGVDDSEIKKAYRRLAKKYHPDSNPGSKEAERRFKEVTESYNVLSDQKKRNLYDKYGHAAFDGSMGDDPEAFVRQQEAFHHSRTGNNGVNSKFYRHYQDTSGDTGNPFDLFSDLFGHGQNGFHDFRNIHEKEFRETQASDMTSDITISLRDAVLGCEKQLTFQDHSIGTLRVTIPTGIKDGQILRLNRNVNSNSGVRLGNILLHVHVKEDLQYTRQDNDLYTHAKIPYTLAALGGDATFQTLYGPVKCRIPAGSQTGRKIRLKGKGVPAAKNRAAGDEYVILDITVPTKLSEREKRLLQELHELEK